MLGFIPCGLVVSAVLAASAAPSLPHTVLAMAAFALGTMPSLMLLAFGGQALRIRYPLAAKRLSQVAMSVSGLWLFALAGQMIF